jgi:hypothetical protein
MTPPARHRAPPPGTSDNESAVRERSSPAASATPPAPVVTAPPASTGSHRDRLEAKLRTGRTLLGTLPASDDRARLLHVAIMRRDEALLDGVLAALGVVTGRSVPPPPR